MNKPALAAASPTWIRLIPGKDRPKVSLGSLFDEVATTAVTGDIPRISVVVDGRDATQVRFWLGVTDVPADTVTATLNATFPDTWLLRGPVELATELDSVLSELDTSLAALRASETGSEALTARQWEFAVDEPLAATPDDYLFATPDIIDARRYLDSDRERLEQSLLPIVNYVTADARPMLWQCVLQPDKTNASGSAGPGELPVARSSWQVAMRSATIETADTDSIEIRDATRALRSVPGTAALSQRRVVAASEAATLLDRLVAMQLGPSAVTSTAAPNRLNWLLGVPSGRDLVAEIRRGGRHPREWIPSGYDHRVIPRDMRGNDWKGYGLHVGRPVTAAWGAGEQPIVLDNYLAVQRTASIAAQCEHDGVDQRYQRLATEIRELADPWTPVIVFDFEGEFDVINGRPVSLTSLIAGHIATHRRAANQVAVLERSAVKELAAGDPASAAGATANTWGWLLDTLPELSPGIAGGSIVIVDCERVDRTQAEKALHALLSTACEQTEPDAIRKRPQLTVVIAQAEALSRSAIERAVTLPHRPRRPPHYGIGLHLSLAISQGSRTPVREKLRTLQQHTDTRLYETALGELVGPAGPVPDAALAPVFESAETSSESVTAGTHLAVVDNPLDDHEDVPFALPVERAPPEGGLLSRDDLKSRVDWCASIEELSKSLVAADAPAQADAGGSAAEPSAKRATAADQSTSREDREQPLPWEQTYVPDTTALPARLGVNREREVIRCRECEQEWPLPTKGAGAMPLLAPLTCCCPGVAAVTSDQVKDGAVAEVLADVDLEQVLEDVDLEQLRAPALVKVNPVKYIDVDATPELCTLARTVYRIMTHDVDPQLEYSVLDSMTDIRDYIGAEHAEIVKYSNESEASDQHPDWFTIDGTPRKYYTLTATGRKHFGLPWKEGEQWGHGLNDVTQTMQHIACSKIINEFLEKCHPAVETVVCYVDLDPDKVDWVTEALANKASADNGTPRLDVVGLDDHGRPVALGEAERDNNDTGGLIADQQTMAIIQQHFDHHIDIIYATPKTATARAVLAELGDHYPNSSALSDITDGTNLYKINDRLAAEGFDRVTLVETQKHLEDIIDTHDRTTARSLRERLLQFYQKNYSRYDIDH